MKNQLFHIYCASIFLFIIGLLVKMSRGMIIVVYSFLYLFIYSELNEFIESTLFLKHIFAVTLDYRDESDLGSTFRMATLIKNVHNL